MRNKLNWLVALGLATVVLTAIMFLQYNTKVNEQRLQKKTQLLEAQTKAQHNAEIQNLKKIIEEKDKELQSKAAEKARIAAETAQKAAERTIPQKVVQSIVPTAQASGGDVQGSIVKWANAYGVDPNWLLRVAKCESGYNPLASNKGYYAGGGNPSGVFQFLPQTFAANAARAGIPGANLWDVDSQAHVAAYMFSIGQSGQWACK
jgi:soluble lytic murein transglycosylase-like protein